MPISVIPSLHPMNDSDLLMMCYELRAMYKRLSTLRKTVQGRERSIFRYKQSEKVCISIDEMVKDRDEHELIDIDSTYWMRIGTVYGCRYNMYAKYIDMYCTSNDHKDEDGNSNSDNSEGGNSNSNDNISDNSNSEDGNSNNYNSNISDNNNISDNTVTDTITNTDTVMSNGVHGINSGNLLAMAIQSRTKPILLMRQMLAQERRRESFTSHEMVMLRHLVSRHGHNWTYISGMMNRTAQQCLHNYKKIMRIGSGRWSSREDALLRTAVCMYGQKWTLVSQHVGTRNDVQCREHYVNVLSVERRGWTDEEDRQLRDAVDRYGRRWGCIGRMMGRNVRECRREYFKLMKGRKHENSKYNKEM